MSWFIDWVFEKEVGSLETSSIGNNLFFFNVLVPNFVASFITKW